LETFSNLDRYENFIKNVDLPQEETSRYLEYLENSHKRMLENSKNIYLLKKVKAYLRENKPNIMIKTQIDYNGTTDNYLFSNAIETIVFESSYSSGTKSKIKLSYSSLLHLLKKYKFTKLKTIESCNSVSPQSVFVTIYCNGEINQFVIINPMWFDRGDEETKKFYKKNKNHIEIAKLPFYGKIYNPNRNKNNK
jgi:hypothetical protein